MDTCEHPQASNSQPSVVAPSIATARRRATAGLGCQHGPFVAFISKVSVVKIQPADCSNTLSLMRRRPSSHREKRRSPAVAVIGTRGYPSHYGGFETAIRHLAQFIAEQGIPVTVYGRRGKRESFSFGAAKVSSVPTWGIDSKSLSTLSYGFFASLHCAFFGPRTALVMNVANGFWLPILRALGVRTAVNVDGIEWERSKWSPLGRRVFRMGAWLTARLADELIFDSKGIEARWREEFSVRGTFIPYGADFPEPAALPLGLPRRGYVLLVARLVPENTVLEFLQAVPEIVRRYPVVIVGTSGYGDDIDRQTRDLAEAHPEVHWLGHISDDGQLAALWEHCGVYFHGHSVGGTNPALVQAMACGAPIVARDTVYNREVLESAAVYVVPDSTAISAAINALMADTRLQHENSALGRARASSFYQWRDVNASYLGLLRSLWEQGTRSSHKR